MKNVILTKGKYEGKTITEVIKIDPTYIKFCYNNKTLMDEIKCPYEPGDIVVGNEIASDHYGVTVKGWVGKVVRSNPEKEPEYMIVEDEKDSYLVRWYYFSPYEKKLLPYSVAKSETYSTRASINRAIKGKKFFFEEGKSINILKKKGEKYLYFLEDGRVLISTLPCDFKPVSISCPIDKPETKRPAKIPVSDW